MAKQYVTVRMYNVGFGDAFLLIFPDKDLPRRVLVDCGVHSMGPGPRKMKEVVQQIVADTTDADKKSRIDVVVCTHRHQDHVSGFSQQFSAMVSTRSTKKWPDIPRMPLLEELRKRSNQIVRSDKRDVPDPAGVSRKPEYVETRVPI